MFDTTCANRKKWRTAAWDCGVPDGCALAASACVGGIVWEEHCVECGQPECFRTCRMYERNFDGKCRRFESGIVPFRVGGKLLHGCEFRKWSKLEGCFSGAVKSVGQSERNAFVDRVVARVAQLLNRLMFFVPGRIGAITIYRRLKLWGCRLANHGSVAQVGGLILRCRASRHVNVHLALISGEVNVYDEVFEMNGDWQTFNAAFKPVAAGTRFLLFSTDEEPFKLAIETLELLLEPASGSYSVASSVGGKDANAPARYVKCLAWDLDNTLWNGILVDDGPDRLVVNKEAVSLIKTLDSRGIINTIISKNDYEPTWKLLEKLGLAEYFVFPTINWQPKSENLKAVAKTINIGLNTFAFVDDSPFERGEVGEHLPMVRVFKNTEISELAMRPEFNPPVSAEGAKRRLSYQKEMQRMVAAQAFAGDYTAFLRSCEIELSLFPLKDADAATYDRCYELIQRTNQLTLAGRRYSLDEFASLIKPSDVEAWGIRCHDKFGDYGIVGVVIAQRNADFVSVREFVMSCRVAKKQCEYSVIEALARRAVESGARVLKTRLVKTGRNTALVAAFDEMPFMKTEVADTSYDYELKLVGAKLPESVNKVVFK